MRLSLAFASLLLGASACGDDAPAIDGAPPAPDASVDAGPMTGTLLLDGTLVVENTMNGTSGAGLRVNCQIRITRDGQPVNDAIVTINPAGTFQTTLVGNALDPNLYEGNYMGYNDTVRLSVRAPGHVVPESTLQGPPMFRVEQPAADAFVVAGEMLHVSWEQPTGAVDRADVALESGFLVPLATDPGVYDIPDFAILAENSDDKVIVTRWRDHVPGGSAPGSTIGFGVRSYQAFHVTP